MNRTNVFERKTNETNIKGVINLDGSGKYKIDTKIGFLDHMLELFTFHGQFDLELTCSGDLHVCSHHSIEDIGIVLGEAFKAALQDKKGIQRYGTCYLPMDESLTRTVIDCSGRGYHIFQGEFPSLNINNFPTEMVEHFFYSFAINAQISLHQQILYGSNDHHKIEALFKGLGRATRIAIQKDQFGNVTSTKGIL